METVVRKSEVLIKENTTLTEDLVCDTLTLVGLATLYNPHGFTIDAGLIKHLPAEVFPDVAET